MFIGTYHDPTFGRVVASSFFQLRLSADSVSFPSDAVLNDASLVFYGTPSYYNKEGRNYQLKYHLYQLTNKLDPVRDYEMGDTVSFDQTDRLQTTDRTLLDPAFAQELFDAINSNKQDEFDDLIKGVAIVPDTVFSEGIVNYPLSNFLDTSFNFIELNYSFQGDTDMVDTVYRLILDQGSDRFCHVSSDRSGTLLDSLKENGDEIKLDKHYLQSAIGMRLKLDFAEFENYFSQFDDVQFNKVELELDVEDEDYAVPTTISIGETTGVNLLDLGVIEGNTYYFRDVAAFNTNSFMLRKFQSMYDDGDWGQLLISPAFDTEVNRAVFSHTKASPGIRFKIYFTELEK